MNAPICIITGVTRSSTYIPLSNLFSIFQFQEQRIKLFLTGDPLDFSCFKNVTTNWIPYNSSKIEVLNVFTYLFLQMRISLQILRDHRSSGTYILIFGSENFFILILLLKILNKQIILFYTGSTSRNYSQLNPKLSYLFICIQKINNAFSNKIILYSKNLISEWNLGNYHHKILIAHRHFLDFTTFTVTISYPDRPPLIGYIGRLSAEKGVQLFVQALPAILSEQKDLRVLIGGDGQLKESIEISLDTENISARVDLPGWISHDDLPKYLNQLRLLVLPSYTEGLPNIMLEAMAYGTPVLSTPVGAIPDVIRDGVTGFIMEDNSPECIARNVIRALNSSELEMIAERGRHFVEEEYTFEKTAENWTKIFQDIK